MSAEIEFLFSFVYQAQFDNGLTEHEFDHVYVGITRSSPQLNHDEAQDRKWFSFEEIDRDISENSQRYTPWFLIMVREYRSHFHQWLLKRGITNQCKH